LNRLGIEPIQRFVAGDLHVNLLKFNWRSYVDQFNAMAG
jgi:hypothetical protein